MAIARIALPVSADTLFDYWIPDGLAVGRGSIVRVRLKERALTGVVMAIAEASDIAPDRVRAIREVVAGIPPLPADTLAMARFVSDYYQEPVGLVLAQMLPPLSRANADRAAAGAAPREGSAAHSPAGGARALLNDAQRAAGEAIIAAHSTFAAFILDGVTGSGKTEVYLDAAAHAIDAGGQVLMLVPEINLTAQLEARIIAALPHHRVVALHSRLASGTRRRHWIAAADGSADLVLGTRLAVFVPMPRLALIIVDEEHDPSYKQADGVRYQGRDAAIWRARDRGVPVVLGSATPALETIWAARRGRYRRLELRKRAIAAARMPAVRLVPQRAPTTDEGLSLPLREAIAACLARGEQSLVFINRRGFSTSLLCANCGWQAGCPNCSARLTVHRDAGRLRCHHCGRAERLTERCPECGNVDLLPMGHGTQRLERALAAYFPAARIARIDRDSTRQKGAFAAVRDRVNAGTLDILVGTQMLAKGHDFPRLTLVGVLGADNALYSTDFRATERLAALLFQVAGRAGRADLAGEVIVQTDFPSHPLYRALVAHDYGKLVDELLAERRAAMLPPFSHLALLTADARTRETVTRFLEAAHAAGTALARASMLPVEVLAPVPAVMPRRAGLERGQIVVQSTARGALQRFLPGLREALAGLPARTVKWALDVDPPGFG